MLVAIDKFRGTLTAIDASRIVEAAFRRASVDVVSVPLADGGEGSLAALLDAGRGWTPQTFSAVDAWGRRRQVTIGSRDGVIATEAAQVIGVALRPPGSGPLTSLGSEAVGHHLKAIFAAGASGVVLFVGGTACVDGGIGAFHVLRPSDAARVTVACDVSVGYLDAVRFAPQKGATEEQLPEVRRGLEDASIVLRRSTGVDPGTLAFAGCGGGLGGALACLGATLEAGAEFIARETRLWDHLSRATIVVTGEGRRDAGTYLGKGPGAVEARAYALGVRVAFVVGVSDLPLRSGEVIHDFELRRCRLDGFDGEAAGAALAIIAEDVVKWAVS